MLVEKEIEAVGVAELVGLTDADLLGVDEREGVTDLLTEGEGVILPL